MPCQRPSPMTGHFFNAYRMMQEHMLRIILQMGAVLLFLAACSGSGGDPKPEAVPPDPPAPSGEAKPVVRFGVISRYNPAVIYEEFQPVMDYLTDLTPYRFELKLGKTYEDAVRFLEQGATQIASLGPVTYLEAHARFGAVPILRSRNANGDPFYRSIIVVRQDSDVKALADLRGRSFCFPSPHSTSGNLFGRYALQQAGIPLRDLGEYTNLKHHDQVAKAVLAGKYEAGAVKDIVAYRYESRGLRILHVSDPIPSVPVVVRADVSPAFVGAVKRALLGLDPENPDHRKMMAGWNEEFKYGFVEAADADYEGIRAMLNDVPGRCGNGCHPDYRF